MRLSDGRKVFAKVASDELTASWLRDEYRVYQGLRAPFMPELLGWDDDGDRPILVLEDLSGGEWQQSWTDDKIKHVLRTLESVAKSKPPAAMPLLEDMRPDLASWSLVAAKPEMFLALKLCSKQWLESALPVMMDCDAKADLSGSELVHLDVRSDNICFLGDRTILVDWNWARIGNAELDAVAWAPSVTVENGPAPETFMHADPKLVALIAGYWAYRAGMPPLAPGSLVRTLQLRLLEVALPWAAKLLKLPASGSMTLIFGLSIRHISIGTLSMLKIALSALLAFTFAVPALMIISAIWPPTFYYQSIVHCNKAKLLELHEMLGRDRIERAVGPREFGRYNRNIDGHWTSFDKKGPFSTGRSG